MSVVMPRFTVEQARAAGRLGKRTYVQRGMLKQDIRRGAVNVGDVLADPPHCLRGVMLFDVALMVPYVGPERLRDLNEEAMLESVNLAVTVDRAPWCDRTWLADRLCARRGR